MAGKIIADTIQAAGSYITLNVGNVTILTANSTGLTITPSSNLNFNVTNSIWTASPGSNSAPSLTFSGNTSTGIFFPSTNTVAISTAATEALRVDSTGKVGVGTSNLNGKFNISNAGATGFEFWVADGSSTNNSLLSYNRSTGAYNDLKISTANTIFAYAGTEAMRIDSSGNVLVGNTTQVSGERFSVGSGSNVLAAWIQQNTNTSGYNVMVLGLGSNGNNTSSSFIRGNTNAVGNWYLYGNGTTSFTSDERLKKNIESTRNGYLEDLAQLRVVKYNWLKDDDGTPKELGLIAQEVEQVFPGLVQDDTRQVSEDDETVYKTLKQSVLPFMLLKAIQEHKVIVDAQAVEIAALKA
jgi:hypothetical protein